MLIFFERLVVNTDLCNSWCCSDFKGYKDIEYHHIKFYHAYYDGDREGDNGCEGYTAMRFDDSKARDLAFAKIKSWIIMDHKVCDLNSTKGE